MRVLLTLVVEILLLILLFVIFRTVKNKLISVKYSLIWIVSVVVMAIIALSPNTLKKVANYMGFELVSNMLFLIGFLILFVITFALTVIVSIQKNEITTLIQELGILKSRVEDYEKGN